jgi:hypothetical protein
MVMFASSVVCCSIYVVKAVDRDNLVCLPFSEGFVFVYLLRVEASDIAVRRVTGAEQGVEEGYQRLVGKAADNLLERAVKYVGIVLGFRHRPCYPEIAFAGSRFQTRTGESPLRARRVKLLATTVVLL